MISPEAVSASWGLAGAPSKHSVYNTVAERQDWLVRVSGCKGKPANASETSLCIHPRVLHQTFRRIGNKHQESKRSALLGPKTIFIPFDSLCFPFPKAEIELFWFRLFLAHEQEGEGGLVQDLHGETSRNPYGTNCLCLSTHSLGSWPILQIYPLPKLI